MCCSVKHYGFWATVCKAVRPGHAKLCRRGGRDGRRRLAPIVRATAANWLIDVIDGASSYLAVGIGMQHISP